MRVRHAEYGDLDDIVDMSEKFYSAVGYECYVPFDRDSMARTIIKLMENDNSCMLYTDGGMVAAIASPHIVNEDHICVNELFWWVDVDKRKNGIGIKLMDALHDWANEMNAGAMFVTSQNALDGDRVGKLYKRMGYQPCEKGYMRKL